MRERDGHFTDSCFARPILEQGAMRLRHFPCGPTVRVVVESQRPAGSVWRTVYRYRVAVERLVGSVEDYATIEQRSVFRNLMAHRPVPQFEIAAVFGLPILVQVDQ